MLISSGMLIIRCDNAYNAATANATTTNARSRDLDVVVLIMLLLLMRDLEMLLIKCYYYC